MKEILSRSIIALAAFVFAMSFFLPVGSDRTPLEIFRWTIDTASSLSTRIEVACFIAVAVVIAYSYVWSLSVALAAALGWKVRLLENRWLHFAFHATGGLLVAALGITMLAVHDSWIPIRAQWTAAAAPFVVLAVMLLAVLSVERTKSVWVIAVLGFLPHVPVQFILARVSMGMDEAPWGFIMGGASAAVAAAGSLCLLFFRRSANQE